jgi:hypothetical protein
MTMADFSFWLFTVSNGLRIVSYLPQIYRIAIDPFGASSIAYSTWFLWAVASAASALYAACNVFDPLLASTNAMNALCCLAVIVLTVCKRRLFRLKRMMRDLVAEIGALEA